MSNYTQHNTTDLHEPLREILSRVGRELQDVAALIEHFETMSDYEKIENIVEATDRVKLLQSIDLAVQKTRCLADFIETISNDINLDILVDLTTALNLVTLSDLKKRLSCAQQAALSSDIYKNASSACDDLDFL